MSPSNIQIEVIRLCVVRCTTMRYLEECLEGEGHSQKSITDAIEGFRPDYLMNLIQYINGGTTHAQDFVRALGLAETELERECVSICLAREML